MSLPTSNEIVIAIDHPKNSDVYFFPINDSVRSKILPSRSRGTPKPWMQPLMLSGIPGQRIHLDVKASRGRITDELGDPKNEQVAELLQSHREGAPNKDIEFADLSPEDVQTWLYWMRRLVNDQYQDAETGKLTGTTAKLIQGTLPELEDIVATGLARRPNYNGELKEGVSPYYQPAKKREKELVGAK